MDYIKIKNPSTPIKAYLKGDIDVQKDISEDIDYLELKDGVILFGDYSDVDEIIQRKDIKFVKIECARTNSKLETVGYENINARIEPGAEIREGATIGENAVIMIGAIINIGANIGKDSMIDMNAVVGSRANIGERVHVGAGAVVCKDVKPYSVVAGVPAREVKKVDEGTSLKTTIVDALR